MVSFPKDLLTLIAHLKKLPGVGTKTAERFAFELISWSQKSLADLGESLKEIQKKIPPCSTCGCLTEESRCRFCDTTSRDTTSLCILASARDAYAVEETHCYKGLYHVIEHLLSPLDGRHSLNIGALVERIHAHPIREIIIALDSTLEGDTTTLYLKKALPFSHLSFSRLAFGLPVGSSLEYIDGGTLKRAIVGRQILL